MDEVIGVQPVDYGLPDKFKEYRPMQWEAVDHVLESESQWDCLCMPTGSGKSLSAMTLAKLLELGSMSIGGIPYGKTVILTPNKGQMDQYMRDFGPDPMNRFCKAVGTSTPRPDSDFLCQVMGVANYPCKHYPGHTCADGPHLGCKDGKQMSSGCNYYGARWEACRRTAITNYSYWLNLNNEKPNLLQLPAILQTGAQKNLTTRMLILDEAHLAPEELSRFLQVTITEREWKDIVTPLSNTQADHELKLAGEDIGAWAVLAGQKIKALKDQLLQCAIQIEKNKSSIRNQKAFIHAYHHLDSVIRKLQRVKDATSDNWVLAEEQGTKWGRKWTWDCVWPGIYANRYLFCNIPKIVLISATIRPKTMALLGVSQDKYSFREWPRVFPPNRGPVYHLPSIRVHYKSSDEELMIWVRTIDQIIESRQDRKGLIHTVSYQRQQYLMSKSRFAHLMMGNTSDPNSPTAAQTVAAFRAAQPGTLLVSPSFSTGWNFPGDDAEYQIISKIAFPPTNTKLAKARLKKDKTGPMYVAVQDFVQAVGRIVRDMVDRGETFVVDNNVTWLMARHRKFAPSYFTFRRIAAIPKPPPKLTPAELAKIVKSDAA